jgi:hypothetical protein
VEGWGGQKVIPRPSADYFVVGRRQKPAKRTDLTKTDQHYSVPLPLQIS